MSNRTDPLGDRLKEYERRESDRRAMRGVPLIARVDGRSFSRFTKGMARPFDEDFANLMIETTKYLVDETNARVGYTQSDEISLILDPFTKDPDSEMSDDRRRGGFGDDRNLFDGRFQKLGSVIAGLATARFMLDAVRLWPDRLKRQLPVFDCRVFEVPDIEEACWALAWREEDALKNAISMACRAYYSPKEMFGKSSSMMQEMLFAKGVNFNDYRPHFKRGTYVQRRAVHKILDEKTLARIPEDKRPTGPVIRRETRALDLPPMRKVTNWIDVLIHGADPVLTTT
jgi:tRNA(His) guanylyltransferase